MAAAVIAAAVFVIIGGAAWLGSGHGFPRIGGTATASSSPDGLAPSGAALPSGGAAPGSSSAGSTSGAITMTAAAAQNPDASSVAAFLNRYFAAINAHSYATYLALLSPQLQQDETPASFDQGFQGTADSAEQLVNIYAADNGDTAVAVTFVSHQNPTPADHEESCTDWNITLYLGQDGNGYLIDAAPPGYHAASSPCQ